MKAKVTKPQTRIDLATNVILWCAFSNCTLRESLDNLKQFTMYKSPFVQKNICLLAKIMVNLFLKVTKLSIWKRNIITSINNAASFRVRGGGKLKNNAWRIFFWGGELVDFYSISLK